MNTKQLTETEADITIMDYGNVEVSKNIGIEFSCDSNKTFKEVSNKAGVTEEQLKETLGPSGQFNTWETDSIIDHIINTHHR